MLFRSGSAIITETGEKENNIVIKEDEFIIMSNFSNSAIKENGINSEWMGADRYELCRDYISKRVTDFTVENGLELLEEAYNKDPDYPTSCSMVFDPKNQEIIIALNRDFSHLWKVSINEGIIQQYSGFYKNKKKYNILGEGIMVSQLLYG